MVLQRHRKDVCSINITVLVYQQKHLNGMVLLGNGKYLWGVSTAETSLWYSFTRKW